MPSRDDLKQDVHIWCMPTGQIDSGFLDKAVEHVLSDDERYQAHRFAREKDRRSYITAHWLLRTALSAYGPFPATDWKFTRSLFGKPTLADPGDPPLYFNLSHSRGMVACAMALVGDVGVDVETIRPQEVTKLARRFFAENEIEQLESLAEDKRHLAFFRFWTLKEAYVKARGRGLSLDLSQFWFPDVMTPEIRIAFAEDWDDDAGDWQFHLQTETDRHTIACAVRCPEGKPVHWRLISGEDVYRDFLK